MTDGGYDEGYSRCPCFWGRTPADMVQAAIMLCGPTRPKLALDLGCGEGKNAFAMARAGIRVVAIDTSEIAITNAIRSFGDPEIGWLVCDLTDIHGPPDAYDIIVATGSLHCLDSAESIASTVLVMQKMTKPMGLNVISTFNDGPQDMSGHDPGFRPTLISHAQYMQMYESWEILQSSDVVQYDQHPHNDIGHSHSITRILARRSK